jgi:hypothetical protein
VYDRTRTHHEEEVMHRTGRSLSTRTSRVQLTFGLAAVTILIVLALTDHEFWGDLVYQLVEVIQDLDRLP